MAERNTYRRNSNDDNFDLDSYLDEKANPERNNAEHQQFAPEKHQGSWFRNTIAIAGISVIALLAFNDWNPVKVYGNIFGIEELQGNAPVTQGQNMVTIPAPPAPVSEVEPVIAERELRALEEQRVLEDRLAREAENFATSDEVLELQQFALEAAIEALRGLEDMDLSGLEDLGDLGDLGDFEGIGVAAEMGIREAMIELEKLREEGNWNPETPLQISSEQYRNQLSDLGLSNEFSDEEIAELFEAGVPTDFIKKLYDLELTEVLGTEGIIETYNMDGQ